MRAWRGFLSLVVALAVVGVLTQLTPSSLPSERYREPGGDGVAHTQYFDARVLDVTSGTAITSANDAGFRTKRRFVVARIEVLPTTRQLTFLELGMRTRDGYRYDALSWYEIDPSTTLYPGYGYRFTVVAEVPQEKLAGLTLEVGPELRTGIVTLQDAARFALPDPLPLSTTPIAIGKTEEFLR